MRVDPLVRLVHADDLPNLAPCTEGARREVEIVVHPFRDAVRGYGDRSEIRFVAQWLVERTPVEQWSQINLAGETVGKGDRETMSAQRRGGPDFFGEVVLHINRVEQFYQGDGNSKLHFGEISKKIIRRSKYSSARIVLAYDAHRQSHPLAPA